MLHILVLTNLYSSELVLKVLYLECHVSNCHILGQRIGMPLNVAASLQGTFLVDTESKLKYPFFYTYLLIV